MGKIWSSHSSDVVGIYTSFSDNSKSRISTQLFGNEAPTGAIADNSGLSERGETLSQGIASHDVEMELSGEIFMCVEGSTAW
jgi:hypothetical protein